MKGYLHWIVDRSQFQLVSPLEHLATYRFNTKVAMHHFCRVCGVAPFYVARSDPNKIDVNARCVQGTDTQSLSRRSFDGQNWEDAYEGYHA